MPESRRVRLLAVDFKFSHFGPHTGYAHLLDYLDHDRFECRHVYMNELTLQAARYLGWLHPRLSGGGQLPYSLLEKTLGDLLCARETRRWRPDVVHVMYGDLSWWASPMLFSALGEAKSRPAVTATFHMPPDWRSISGHLSPKGLRQIDRIFVLGSEHAERFSGLGLGSKVRFIPHGVDRRFFRRPQGTRPSPSNRLGLLCVGSTFRDSRVLSELSLWCALQNSGVELDLVGPPSSFVPIQNERVRVHRGIADDQLLHLYRNADLFVMPLTRSVANNALLEAVSCGLPLVASDLPGVRDYLRDPEAHWVRPGEPKEFIEAVSTLCSSPEKRAELAQASERAAQRFDWQLLARSYEREYALLAERRVKEAGA